MGEFDYSFDVGFPDEQLPPDNGGGQTVLLKTQVHYCLEWFNHASKKTIKIPSRIKAPARNFLIVIWPRASFIEAANKVLTSIYTLFLESTLYAAIISSISVEKIFLS